MIIITVLAACVSMCVPIVASATQGYPLTVHPQVTILVQLYLAFVSCNGIPWLIAIPHTPFYACVGQ